VKIFAEIIHELCVFSLRRISASTKTEASHDSTEQNLEISAVQVKINVIP
jgi:hypothetical protein